MKKNRIPSLSLLSKGKANKATAMTREIGIDRGAGRAAQLLSIIIISCLFGLLAYLTGCASLDLMPTAYDQPHSYLALP